MKNKYLLIITIIATITGAFIGILLYKNDSFQNNQSKSIAIEGTNFTLNDVMNNFLDSNYSIQNNCKYDIDDTKAIVNCDNNNYTVDLNGSKLNIETNKKNLDFVKEIVNSIQICHGAENNYFKYGIARIFNEDINVDSIKYDYLNEDAKIVIDAADKFDKIMIGDVITEETIKPINDIYYEMQVGEVIINNLALRINENQATFTADVKTNNLNKQFIFRLYDDDYILLKEQIIAVDQKLYLTEIIEAIPSYYSIDIK